MLFRRMMSENELKTNFVKRVPLFRYFWERSFFHYLWTGGLFTVLNIFLVWLFIDVFKIPTVISSSVVIGGLFIARYMVYRVFKVI